MPRIKRFLSEVQAGVVPQTIWPHSEVGHTQEAKSDLLERVTFEEIESMFETPKPVRLIEQVLRIATGSGPSTSDLVLDFFAGSGTTGESVLRLNQEDGGSRRFILVQLPEPTGYSDFPTIAEITRERIRATGNSMRSAPTLASPSTDIGFRSFRLTPSNFRIWNASAQSVESIEEQLTISVEHVVDGSSELSMLVELLLKAGYPVTSPVEPLSFAGVPGYSVADGALLICLSRSLSIEAFEAMVAVEPAMILVLDAGFGASDELKVNALQTVRARNQQTGNDVALRVV